MQPGPGEQNDSVNIQSQEHHLAFEAFDCVI